MYKMFIRKMLFLLEAEAAHAAVCRLVRLPLASRIMGMWYRFEHPSLQREVLGIRFKNPVGVAAGFDKNGELVNPLGDLGFGFIEIGTVTPRPQPGNPKPRLFRLLKDEALINRMGFNNDGAEAVRKRLLKKKPGIIIGGNIGKNKTTPNEEAWRDYELCLKTLGDVVDYFVINVSSPNTPGLRELQEKEPLTKLLLHLKKVNESSPHPRPILLKIAPDLTEAQFDDIIDIVLRTGIDGVVATNTTISRDSLRTPAERVKQIGEGGLSGKPLAKRSTEVIRYLHEKSGGAFPIIGVGGIHSPADAIEKLNAGASLVQLYTGFVYQGPALIMRIKKELLKEFKTPS